MTTLFLLCRHYKSFDNQPPISSSVRATPFCIIREIHYRREPRDVEGAYSEVHSLKRRLGMVLASTQQLHEPNGLGAPLE
jgi:hypothetical protein